MEYLNKSIEELEKEVNNLLKSMDNSQQPQGGTNAQTNSQPNTQTPSNTQNNSNSANTAQTNTENNINKSLGSSNETGDLLNLVKITISDTIKSLDLTKSLNQNNTALEILAKSLISISKAQSLLISEQNKSNELYKSLSEKVESINNKILEIEKQPMARKSIDNISVIERDLNKSVNGTNENLTKSQIASVLNEEFYKGNPSVTEQDIISFDSGVPLRQDLYQLVLNKSKQLNII